MEDARSLPEQAIEFIRDEMASANSDPLTAIGDYFSQRLEAGHDIAAQVMAAYGNETVKAAKGKKMLARMYAAMETAARKKQGKGVRGAVCLTYDEAMEVCCKMIDVPAAGIMELMREMDKRRAQETSGTPKANPQSDAGLAAGRRSISDDIDDLLDLL